MEDWFSLPVEAARSCQSGLPRVTSVPINLVRGWLGPVDRLDDRPGVGSGTREWIADGQVDRRDTVATTFEVGPDQIPHPGPRVGAMDGSL